MNEEAITILRNLAERLRAAVENDNLRTASYLFSKEEVIRQYKEGIISETQYYDLMYFFEEEEKE